MKLRSLENLPVLLEFSTEEIGQVKKAVVGDDFKLAYLVINCDKTGPGIIFADDFTLGKEAVIISDTESIKSYAHGEESSIYEKKLGDTVFDREGKELGVLSDFIISSDEKRVLGLELSSGLFKDILEGRSEIPLQSVKWASLESAVISREGSDVL